MALPAELPVEVGSHAEPLSVGSQAVKLAQVGPGDPVLVYGVGPIGLYSIMALKLAGAGPIVAAGRWAGRRQAAADVGADVVIDTREISVADYAKQSGTLFAAALECSAAPGAFNEALAVTEPGGTVVEVALTPESALVPLFPLISEGTTSSARARSRTRPTGSRSRTSPRGGCRWSGWSPSASRSTTRRTPCGGCRRQARSSASSPVPRPDFPSFSSEVKELLRGRVRG